MGRRGSGDVAVGPVGSLRTTIANAPADAPRVPRRLYAANARGLRPRAATSAPMDCSTERTGPPPAPVGLGAPRKSAIRATGKLGARARTVPATVISSPKIVIAFRRPKRAPEMA